MGKFRFVATGELVQLLQQRIKDAEFENFVVTLMGGDQVFLHCLGKEAVTFVLTTQLVSLVCFSTNLRKCPNDVVYDINA